MKILTLLIINDVTLSFGRGEFTAAFYIFKLLTTRKSSRDLKSLSCEFTTLRKFSVLNFTFTWINAHDYGLKSESSTSKDLYNYIKIKKKM